MIPKIIHFIWIGCSLPDFAKRNIAEFKRLNPDYEIKVHGEEILAPEYKKYFDASQRLDSKSDLLRISALKRYGGWYFDTDFWPVRSLDEAVSAFGITGKTLFVARQHYNKNAALYISNGVLAASLDCLTWPALDAVFSHAPAGERVAYGPAAMVELHKQHPELLHVSGWPWWFPANHNNAVKFIGLPADLMREIEPETGGQMPFAIHLWAAGNQVLPEPHANKTTGTGSRLALIVYNQTMAKQDGNRMAGFEDGFKSLGFKVQYDDCNGVDEIIERCQKIPDVVVFWNGMRRSGLVTQAKKFKIPYLITEHGFFQRNEYIQCDPKGFLHWASWANKTDETAPTDGRERFLSHFPEGIKPYQANKGHVLVLGQVNSDTQMAESEIQGSDPLQKAVAGALPNGTIAFFRPHPQCSQRNLRIRNNRNIIPEFPNQNQERMQYNQCKHGVGLAEALKDCRFAIAINSNALNEALIAGIPCMAFGPFLGINAGVVKKTSLATIKADVLEMLNGWHPEQSAVENYLHWLAAKQWNAGELAKPKFLKPLLVSAGVKFEDAVCPLRQEVMANV